MQESLESESRDKFSGLSDTEGPVQSAKGAPHAEKIVEEDSETGSWFRFREWFLTPSDQLIIGFVCAVIGGWVLIRAISLSAWRSQEIEIRRQEQISNQYSVDLNEANWLELSLIEGIGEVLGRRIVAYREEQGPFENIDDLEQVNGIGARTLEKIRPHLKLGSSMSAE